VKVEHDSWSHFNIADADFGDIFVGFEEVLNSIIGECSYFQNKLPSRVKLFRRGVCYLHDIFYFFDAMIHYMMNIN